MREVTDPKILEQLNGQGNLQEVTDPAVLAQLNGQDVQVENQSNNLPVSFKDVFKNVLLNVPSPLPFLNPTVLEGIKNQLSPDALKRGLTVPLAGGRSGAQKIFNMPHTLANMISPELGKMIKPAFTPKTTDEQLQAQGIENPHWSDKAVAQMMEYMPYGLIDMAGAGLTIPKQLGLTAAAGAGYGLGEGSIGKAIEGALINAGTLGGAYAIPGIGNAIRNFRSKYAGHYLKGDLEKKLDIAKELPADAATYEASKNYNEALSKENSLWEKTKELSQYPTFESSVFQSNMNPPPVPSGVVGETVLEPHTFNNSTYLKHIDDFMEKVKGYTPTKQKSYEEAIQFAQEMKNIAPSNLEDVVIMRQQMNEYLRNFASKKNLDKADRETLKFAEGLKDNLLRDTLDANEKNYSPEFLKEFRDSWSDANKATQERHRDFLETFNTKGKVTPNAFSQAIKNPNADQSAFIRDYLPKKGELGTERFDQLEKMIGDRNLTENILKQSLFKHVYNKNEISLKKFFTKYNNLSREQQSYLFNAGERNQLVALEKILAKHGERFDKSKARIFGHYSVPTLTGAMIGKMLGAGFEPGMLGGLGAAYGAEKVLTKIFSNPKLAEKVVSDMLSKEKAKPELLHALRLGINPLAVSQAAGQ